MNLTNPKSLVYYTSIFAAMLPPATSVATRFAVVAIVVTESAVWHSGLAVLFATPRLQRVYCRFGRWIDRVAGSVFVAVGARFLIARN